MSGNFSFILTGIRIVYFGCVFQKQIHLNSTISFHSFQIRTTVIIICFYYHCMLHGFDDNKWVIIRKHFIVHDLCIRTSVRNCIWAVLCCICSAIVCLFVPLFAFVRHLLRKNRNLCAQTLWQRFEKCNNESEHFRFTPPNFCIIFWRIERRKRTTCACKHANRW